MQGLSQGVLRELLLGSMTPGLTRNIDGGFYGDGLCPRGTAALTTAVSF